MNMGENHVKITSSVVLGCLATFTQEHALLIIFVLCAIVLDVISGLIKAGATGKGLSSDKGLKGFFKKMALLTALAFGFFLDFFIPVMCQEVSIQLPFKTPFALIICFYIVINESISVAENLYETDSRIIPKWIINLLKLSKKKIEEINEVEKDAQTEVSEDK